MALIVPLALAGCGRKGPLDPPPSAATPPPPGPQSQAAPSTTGLVDPFSPSEAQPAQAARATPSQPQSKSFLLDPLIQ